MAIQVQPPQATTRKPRSLIWAAVAVCVIAQCALLSAIVAFVKFPVDAQSISVVPATFHSSEASPEVGQTVLIGMDASDVKHKLGSPNACEPHAFGRESDAMWTYVFRDRPYIVLFRNNKVAATQDLNEDGTWNLLDQSVSE